MYIENLPSKNKKHASYVLLRETTWKNGKSVKKTIANISSWNKQKIEALRLVLKGNTQVGTSSFEILRSLPHGNTLAVLGTMKHLGLPAIIASKATRVRDILLGLIAQRILSPRSKLATTQDLHPDTATSTLFEELHLSDLKSYDVYDAMDYLYKHKPEIEKRLAKKHLSGNCLVLYDLTSVFFEGETCPLTFLGHSKDKKGSLQIVVGLLTNKDGVPISTEVFEGNTLDHQTLVSQINKVRTQYTMKDGIFVGDRGTIIAKRITEDMKGIAGLSFVTALGAKQVAGLMQEGSLQLSLFDKADLAEIKSELYPDERLICCRNPLLAEERKAKREALLKATEKELDKIVTAVKREKRPLFDKAQIGLRVGKVINKYKMNKHIIVTIDEGVFSYQRDESSIAKESLLDGVYVIRTTVTTEVADMQKAVTIYKSLANVEKAFRCMKTTDLDIRPVFHHLPERVKAHVFLCMLAYYVEYHMRESLAPILFIDEEKEDQSKRGSVVAQAIRSNGAKEKDKRKMTPDGYPVQSFRKLLSDLATLTRNTIAPKENETLTFKKLTNPTLLQKKALDLLKVPLTPAQ
jgi:transposase